MEYADIDLAGFSTNTSSLDNILKEFVNNTESDQLASYVNQWMVHILDNCCIPVGYYYNKGNLNGQTLFDQFQHVVEAVEATGYYIYGLSLDAGGSNVGLVTALQTAEFPESDSWIDSLLTTIQHPSDGC